MGKPRSKAQDHSLLQNYLSSHPLAMEHLYLKTLTTGQCTHSRYIMSHLMYFQDLSISSLFVCSISLSNA